MLTLELDFSAMQTLNHVKMVALRESAGLKQVQAAKRAKMSVTQWNDMEHGRRTGNLKIETIARIASALGCLDVRELITDPPADKKTRKLKD